LDGFIRRFPIHLANDAVLLDGFPCPDISERSANEICRLVSLGGNAPAGEPNAGAEMSIDAEEAALIKEMLVRGDKQQWIVAWFGGEHNSGRIADITPARNGPR